MLLLNGIDLQSYPYEFFIFGGFDIGKTLIKSDVYSHGTFLSRSKINERSFIIRGFINSDNTYGEFEDVENSEDILKKELFKDGLKEIAFMRGNKVVKIYAEVENISNSFDESIAYEINLIAPDPYIYGESTIIELGKNIYNGLKMPFKFPFKINGTDFTNFHIPNHGTEKLYPKITVKGPCSNFEIKNETTGKAMYFNLPLDQYDTLVIDNNPSTRGVKLNGYNVISQKIGDWIDCGVGGNVMSYGYRSNSTDKLVTVEYRERFL